jgi:uncharacterized Zn finger protein
MRWSQFPPYVSVAERKQQAARKIAQLKKKGIVVQPVVVQGPQIAKTFWGKAWCNHLESYSDYENRLARGRSYLRHGSVLDLQVDQCGIKALVCGSSIYDVKISISPVAPSRWNTIVEECSGKIDSLIELLQGKFSKNVMEIIIHREKGLFPHPNEIKLRCSCPDSAKMCKHVAAVLYGIGAHLDERPQDLFLLRQADHLELISKAGATSLITNSLDQQSVLSDDDLSTLFNIDIGQTSPKAIKQKKVVRKKPPLTKNTKMAKKSAKQPLIKTISKLKSAKKKPSIAKRKTIKKPTKNRKSR